MSKKPVRLAIIETINEFEFGFPYQGAQRGRLFLRVHPRYGRDVFLVIRRGQFLCRPDDCRVMVRFDDSPGQRFNAAEPANFDSTTLFIRDYDKFLGGLSKAKKLYIEVAFYQEGSRTFEFDVSGLKWQP